MNKKILRQLILISILSGNISFQYRNSLNDIYYKNINTLEQQSNDEKELEQIKLKLEGLVIENYQNDNPKHLTIDSTYEEAMDLVLEVIKQNLKINKNISFELKNLNIAYDFLKEGTNEIEVKMTLNETTMDVKMYISNVTMTDESRIRMVQKELAKMEIDGSSLTTANTVKDTLSLIKKQIEKIDKKVKVQLWELESKQKLVENKNNIEILISSNNLKIKTKVAIINVRKSNIDKLEEVAKIIIEDLNFKDYNLTTANTKKDILNLLKDKFNNQNIKFKIENEDKKLNLLEKEINVEIEIEGATKKVNIMLNKTFVLKKDRVTLISEIINNLKIDGRDLISGQFVTEDKVQKLIINKINENIKHLLDKSVKVTFKILDKIPLSVGNNKIRIVIVADKESKEATVNIINVKSPEEVELIKFKNYIDKEIKTFDGRSLDTKNNITDALNLIRKKVSEKFSDVVIDLKDKKIAKQNLKEKEDKFEIIITRNGKSETILIKLINVRKPDLSVLIELYKILLKELIIDGSKLTTENTYKDFLNLIIEKIRVLNKEVEILPLDEKLLDKNLIFDINAMVVVLKLNNHKKLITFVLKGVKWSDSKILDKIVKHLELRKLIINVNLSSNLTIKDLKNELGKNLECLKLEKNVFINVYENNKIINDDTKLVNFKGKILKINVKYGKKELNFDHELSLIK